MAKKKAKRRPSIGTDPLDAVVPSKGRTLEEMRRQFAVKQSRRGLAPAGTTPKPETKATKPGKIRATFHLPEDLFEECRDAVVHLSGPPVRLTLAALAENALRRELARLKKAHNRGKVFPKRKGDLKGGRPIGS